MCEGESAYEIVFVSVFTVRLCVQVCDVCYCMYMRDCVFVDECVHVCE
jgi:hypothetical protein